jgi:two-component system, chemotaxis family, sensor kinase CheA
VRDLAQKQNKKIEFQILGSETELDKNMIEKISDPLKHMVRNAIDHGLETPEDRKMKGKPEIGNLFLEAYYKEGNVVIEIRDDGKGLDKNRILAKAVEKGLVDADENISEQKIFQMIFLPGFSTAHQVTDISGRGVGMDVVRQNIESLRGKIEIFSAEGQGTTFRILLPLTMAIIDGMLVTVNETYYVIPLLSIVESFKPETNIISSVEGNVEVIEYREEYIPLIRLTEALYQSQEKKPLSESILIIVESNGKKYGFQADELIGQQQIVVKSLETNYRNVSGLSGATILGDGKVALILDIEGIVKNIMHHKEHLR